MAISQNLPWYVTNTLGTGDGTQWDQCYISAVGVANKKVIPRFRIPGIVNINFEIEFDIDDAQQQGNDAMRIILKGKRATRFTMTVRTWTYDQFVGMSNLLTDLELQMPGKPRYKFAIEHPMLVVAGVRGMYVKKVKVPQPNAAKPWDWTFECIEDAQVVKAIQNQDAKVKADFEKKAGGPNSTGVPTAGVQG